MGICGHRSSHPLSVKPLAKERRTFGRLEARLARQFRKRVVLNPDIPPGGDAYAVLTAWAALLHLHGGRRRFERCQELLRSASRHNMLDPTVIGIRQAGSASANRVTAGLCALMRVVDHWIRPPEDWRPRIADFELWFADLARYLMAERTVPRFMDYAWFTDEAMTYEYRRWWLAMARGRSLRHEARPPTPMTPKMFREFIAAPGHLTIGQALRWGQVIGLGGDADVAVGVVESELGRCFCSEDFWMTVIRYFIQHREIQPEEYGPIVDYIIERRFVPQGFVNVGGGLVEMGPVQPHLSMKGRSPGALRREVERWHRQLAAVPRGRFETYQRPLSWESCGIGGFKHVANEGQDSNAYVVRELKNSDELRYEGLALSHCVLSYSARCESGKTAIFSLRRVAPGEAERPWLTIGFRC
jgi:hypothetical protein